MEPKSFGRSRALLLSDLRNSEFIEATKEDWDPWNQRDERGQHTCEPSGKFLCMLSLHPAWMDGWGSGMTTGHFERRTAPGTLPSRTTTTSHNLLADDNVAVITPKVQPKHQCSKCFIFSRAPTNSAETGVRCAHPCRPLLYAVDQTSTPNSFLHAVQAPRPKLFKTSSI